jgi:hypothetical protein
LDSTVQKSGSAGAALLQQCSVQLQNCSFDSNTAQQDAGALMVHQATELSLVNTNFSNNVAALGVGGALTVTGALQTPGSAAAAVKLASAEQTAASQFASTAATAVFVGLQDCSFTGNAAPAGSGGAAVFNSQLGSLTVSCKSCSFAENSGGGDGGGVAAFGQTVFDCIDCSADSNKADGSGGWMYCSGCSSMSLTGGSSTQNTAGAAGGAVACQGCAAFAGTRGSYSSNTAASGGAIAVQSAAELVLDSCELAGNAAYKASDVIAATAAESNGDGGFSASPLQLQLANAMPQIWRSLYDVGSTAGASSADCSAAGSGGAVCVSSTAAAALHRCVWRDNRAVTGGAVFAAADCGSGVAGAASSDATSGSSSSGCQINMTVDSATGNVAEQAGGVLYTSTAEAVHLHSSSSSSRSSSSSTPGGLQVPWALLQQLAHDNSVGAGGYGPGAASFPAQLSLIGPEQLAIHDQQQQQQRRLYHPEQEQGQNMQQQGKHGRHLRQQQQQRVIIDQQQQQQKGSRHLLVKASSGGGSSAAAGVAGKAPSTADDNDAVGKEANVDSCVL